MEQDRGIEYNAKLTEVKSLIQKVKTIEFNTSKIEQEVKEMEQKVEQEVSNNYKNYSSNKETEFLSDALINTYTKATSRLNKIMNYLKKEYNEYYDIYYDAIKLENDLSNINENNITQYLKDTKELISRINKTSQMDYELEEKIVEKVYQVSYIMIKLETIYLNEEELLNYIKQNDINISYIYKYIEEEIKAIDMSNYEYKEINDKYLEIQSEGLENVLLLNRELIKLLALVNNQDLIDKKRESFLEKCNVVTQCNEDKRKLEMEQLNTTNTIQELKTRRKKLRRQKLKRKLFLLGNFATLSAAAFGLGKIAKNVAVDTTYKTTIETYDSSVGRIKTEEKYLKETKNETIITEYLPWVEPGYFRDEYTREIYTYDATNIDLDYDNILDYLTPEILEHGVTVESEPEHREEVPEEELYTENIYQIKKATQDLKITHKDPNPTKFKTIFTIEMVVLLIFDLLFLSKLSKKFPTNKEERQQIKEKLKIAKKLLLEKNQEFDKKLKEYEALKTTLLEEYNKLPVVLHDNPTVKKRIKELSLNQNNNQE